ncbi:hypothetical protein CTI12_AA283840 [Artemisia annua]|uniref:EVE domain-containing protein n=1 Tax=Artemisia annua TaxID=35608 RepID=A0A2U1NA29_ARTAN|nr:hypothetical protein CTI12_AA283840 [Artemisia annua]
MAPKSKANSQFPIPAINSTTKTPKKTHTLFENTTKMSKPNTTKTQYWLLKTEPNSWSWDDQKSNNNISKWDGVKNHQAIKNLKSMHLNDLCFFYHSGTKSRCIVGVVTVIREWYEDEESGGGAVDVKEVGEMRRIVDLKEMKKELLGVKGFKEFGLFKQSRLSVVPVEEGVWVKICEMGNGYEGDGFNDGECDK